MKNIEPLSITKEQRPGLCFD